jgi:precorrin-3B synthase
MSVVSLRKGWCPGVLRPMMSGDGLLVRIRPRGGRLSLDHAEALAECAARFGNGMIEISSRANLQLRGIREASLSALQDRLDSLGLLDSDEATESLRNIVASPISDCDPSAILDVAPVVEALEARLAADATLRRLPPKFGFLVDGGGALPLGDVEADIRLEAFESVSGTRWALILAGADEIATSCAPNEAVDGAADLACAFLREAGAGENAPRRMRALVAQRGAAAIFAAAGCPVIDRPAPRRRAPMSALLGVHAFGPTYTAGAALPLGRMAAEVFSASARMARDCGARDIRLTPWRALLAAGLRREGADRLSAFLNRNGFILDPDDSRLAVVACAGAPACANAARPVQADALAFAQTLPAGRGIVLHVSGCEKGCAYAKIAPVTLVARAAGYDVIVAGRAADPAMREGLSVEAASSMLAQEFGGDVQ